MTSELHRVSPHFGENVFGFDLMKQRLPREFYDKLMFAIRNRRPISAETADVVAQAMKEWALGKGATHYTHWFQPLTGLTAEKHDSFLDIDKDGRPIARFSGQNLIVSEPDASSFPHGGLRSTFEARGYAAWDPSSPAFLMKRKGSATLCLPSVFVAYKGEVLDKKTPLLRSVATVSKSAVRMLRLLGNKRATSVMPHVGAEQEYFLVDSSLAAKRPDICEVGATVLGLPPARGQQLEDHYFRAINERVLSYMEEVEDELVRLGVPVKTRHNEVSPAQFELAALHQPANIASDQNQLVMEVLQRVALRHDLVALLHEKPFALVNGSGKHNNWSLIDSEGTNLLQPGTNQSSQLRFLVFLVATILGAKRHGSLLSAIIAGPGNDLRLGGNEAPPRITSVYLGDYLTDLLENLTKTVPAKDDVENIDLGLGGVARLPRDTTDRNRTSPFAFTGNKFEFRAVGSSAAISLPNVVINAMTAEALDTMSDQLEKKMNSGMARPAAVLAMLGDVIKDVRSCMYDGDCYTREWAMEAERRGLLASSNAPEAIESMVSESSFSLFEKYEILSRQEVEARHHIKLDFYTKTMTVELTVARRMLATQVLPAAIRYQKRLAGALIQTREALGTKADGLEVQATHLETVSALIAELIENIEVLIGDEKVLGKDGSIRELAMIAATEVRRHLNKAREVSDQLEDLVDHREWPLPSYDELLRVG
ncbi:MAG: glutamine synthetase type III [Deltaproteobacteria bacterium]|nr:glutamine synthetase type III [Deltaproteobacteria bacterium]